MSLRPSSSRPSTCSGDMYEGVPMAVPGRVRPESLSQARAIPKSASRASPTLSSR
jgi:hypothetical protein